MPKDEAEEELLAVLGSLPGAGPQGVHCDSLKPGATGITSYEQDQYIYIVFFAPVYLYSFLCSDQDFQACAVVSCVARAAELLRGQ